MSRIYMTHLVRGVPFLDATRLLRRLGLLGGLGIRTFSGTLVEYRGIPGTVESSEMVPPPETCFLRRGDLFLDPRFEPPLISTFKRLMRSNWCIPEKKSSNTSLQGVILNFVAMTEREFGFNSFPGGVGKWWSFGPSRKGITPDTPDPPNPLSHPYTFFFLASSISWATSSAVKSSSGLIVEINCCR